MTDADVNKLDIPRTDTGSLAEQAAEWCAYLYSGQDTQAGRQQFCHWLKRSEAHARTYTEIEQWWRDLDYGVSAVGHSPDIVSIKPEKRTTLVVFRSGWPLALAATFLLAVGIGLLRFYAPSSTPAIQHSSGTGEIKTVELSDGSQVTLGGESEILIRLEGDTREVELTRGGAFFDVAPNKERTFLVHASAADIRVIGTRFDVLKGVEGVRVSVVEGVVHVTPGTKPGTPNSEGDVRLTAGQQIVVDRDGALSGVQPFDADAVLAWRYGHLEYVDARLEDIVAEVNRYRKQKITLLEPDLGDIRITIAMPVGKTERLLTGLAASSPVEIDRTAFGVTIKKRK